MGQNELTRHVEKGVSQQLWPLTAIKFDYLRLQVSELKQPKIVEMRQRV